MTLPVSVSDLRMGFPAGAFWRRRFEPVLRGVELELNRGDPGDLRPERRRENNAPQGPFRPPRAPERPGQRPRFVLPRRPTGSPAIGFASGEERSLFFRLTGRRNLDFFASPYGLSTRRARERIEVLGPALDLTGILDERVDRLSSGMRARLGLARALLHEPELLLLDEPTKSLDPDHAAAVHDLLRPLARERRSFSLPTTPKKLASSVRDSPISTTGSFALPPRV